MTPRSGASWVVRVLAVVVVRSGPCPVSTAKSVKVPPMSIANRTSRCIQVVLGTNVGGWPLSRQELTRALLASAYRKCVPTTQVP